MISRAWYLGRDRRVLVRPGSTPGGWPRTVTKIEQPARRKRGQ